MDGTACHTLTWPDVCLRAGVTHLHLHSWCIITLTTHACHSHIQFALTLSPLTLTYTHPRKLFAQSHYTHT